MTKLEKLIKKLLSKPHDLTWDEVSKILGFEQIMPGKTGGSRRKFKNNNNIQINLHRPHPGNIIKTYAIEYIIETLKKEGLLWKI